MTQNETVVAWVLGGAVVVGTLYFALRPAAAATPAAMGPVGPVTRNVTLMPGTNFPVVRAQPGDTIVIELLAGASWLPGANLPVPVPLGGSTPITWVYQGGGSVTLNWTSPTTGAQQTTITFE